MNHVSEITAGQWAAGVLEEAEALAVAEHAASCRECEQLLMAEATFETRLAAVLEQQHLTVDEAAQWAAGLCEPDVQARVEAHARGCPECEARLQVEARAEVRVTSAIAKLPIRSRSKWFVVVPLAAAATVAFLLFGRTELTGVTELSDDAGTLDVADSTHFLGEAPPPEAFTANAPFSL
ncbi:MAG: hypothetical protein QM817_17430 [Archangium sp.]